MNAQAHSEKFTIGTNCVTATVPTTDQGIAPGENVQRSACPFVNAMADGKSVDLFDMAHKMELLYNVAAEYLREGPIQKAIDCNQTYVDENGIVRIDLDTLFDDKCEEHQAIRAY